MRGVTRAIARFSVTVLAGVCLATAPSSARAGEWLAGDLHVHSTFSHDSYGGPSDDNSELDDVNTLGFSVSSAFSYAAARGLDFLAITDHNDVRSATDPGFGSSGVIGVAGYENSLNGHAQMLGTSRLFPEGDPGSAAYVQDLADAIRAEGGLFQINHPVNSTTDTPDDLDWELGYAVQPDTVEAWNGPRFYQPPFPAANSHDDAVRYWEGWLNRGAHVGLSGGSDSHWLATAAAQGSGQPTVWVFAETPTQAGIVEGLRRGRTTISHQPPTAGAPRVFLEADRDGDGRFESMVGDTVAPGTPLRARVEGASGTLLRVATDGGEEAFAPVPVTRPDFEHRFVLPAERTWVRAEVGQEDALAPRQSVCPGQVFGAYCRNRVAIVAMTAALYFRDAATVGGPAGAPTPAVARCPDRRSFSFHLHRDRGSAVVRVAVFVDGRRRRVRRGRDLTRVAIAPLRRGRHVVRIVSTHRNGVRWVSRRTYDDCAKSAPRTRRVGEPRR